MKATVALNACDANLAIALYSLLDSKVPEQGSSDLAWDPPGFSIVRA